MVRQGEGYPPAAVSVLDMCVLWVLGLFLVVKGRQVGGRREAIHHPNLMTKGAAE